jgi:hypothetical protein
VAKDRKIQDIIQFVEAIITFFVGRGLSIEVAIDKTVTLLSTDSLVAKDRKIQDTIDFVEAIIAFFVGKDLLVEVAIDESGSEVSALSVAFSISTVAGE